MWASAKALLRGKLIALNSYIRKKERTQINNLSSYFKKLEKEEQNKAKVGGWKEIIKIRTEINEIEYRNTEKINETKSWFFEKTINKPLAKLTYKMRRDTNHQYRE